MILCTQHTHKKNEAKFESNQSERQQQHPKQQHQRTDLLHTAHETKTFQNHMRTTNEPAKRRKKNEHS